MFSRCIYIKLWGCRSPPQLLTTPVKLVYFRILRALKTASLEVEGSMVGTNNTLILVAAVRSCLYRSLFSIQVRLRSYSHDITASASVLNLLLLTGQSYLFLNVELTHRIIWTMQWSYNLTLAHRWWCSWDHKDLAITLMSESFLLLCVAIFF